MFRDMLPSDFVLGDNPIPDEFALEDVHGRVAPKQRPEITEKQMDLAVRLLYAE